MKNGSGNRRGTRQVHQQGAKVDAGPLSSETPSRLGHCRAVLIPSINPSRKCPPSPAQRRGKSFSWEPESPPQLFPFVPENKPFSEAHLVCLSLLDRGSSPWDKGDLNPGAGERRGPFSTEIFGVELTAATYTSTWRGLSHSISGGGGAVSNYWQQWMLGRWSNFSLPVSLPIVWDSVYAAPTLFHWINPQP